MPMVRGKSLAPGIIDTAPNKAAKMLMKYLAPKMFKDLPYQELYLLDGHKRFRDRVKSAKMVYIGGCHTVESIEEVMSIGVDFIQVARAAIKDPQFVNNIRAQGPNYKNGCTHCNYCLTSIDRPGGVHCVLNDPHGLPAISLNS